MIDASQNNDKALVCIIDDNHGVRGSFDVLLTVYGFHVVGYRSAMAFLVDQRPILPRCLIIDQNQDCG
jgi:FixJ family two-component response regulator